MDSIRTTRGLLGLSIRAKILLLALVGAVWFLSDAGGVAAGAGREGAAVAAEQEGPAAQTSEDDHAQDEGYAYQEHADGEHGDEHGPPISSWFLVLVAILVFAKVFGEVAERIGQPAVLGELIAGVVLGGSVLGIVPAEGLIYEIIHYTAEVGVAILLFEIGLETDLKEMFKVGTSSALVAIVGVTLPFLLGYLYWLSADPAIGAVSGNVSLSMVAIFVGATLTATSVGITARVLGDIRMMNRPESKIIIGAAVIDDVMGLVILGVVSGLAAGGTLSAVGIAVDTVMAVGFLVVAVVIGNYLAPPLFQLVDRMRVRGVLLVAAFAFALLVAALADKAGSALIIGAFAAGIVLSGTNQFDQIEHQIRPVADIFTPVFFVSVGAVVNVRLFIPGAADFNAEVLVVGAILVAVAFIGKLAAGFAVGWGREKLNQMAIGVGMVPRGEVGLIFAALGRSTGILSDEAYSAILIMVIVTTFIAPPLLKLVFRPGADDPSPPQPEPAH